MSDRKKRQPPRKPRVAVIVTGMHRGGGSAVAGTAIRLGLAPPRTMVAPGADNPMGVFESAAVVNLNHSLLRAVGCTWDDCLSFDPHTLNHAARSAAFYLCQLVLREEFGAASAFVMKDPRLALTLPLWLPALREAGAAVSVLLVLRHPAEVARSLFRRDFLPDSVTAPLWLHHMLEAERMSRSLPRAVVMYDDLLRDWRWCLAWAGSCAGITWPSDIDGLLPHVDSFVRPSLRHHVVTDKLAALGPPSIRDMIATAWRALQQLRDDVGSHSAQAALDDVRAEFALWRKSEARISTAGNVIDLASRAAPASSYLRSEVNWQQRRQIMARPSAGFAFRPQWHDDFSEGATLEVATSGY